METDSEDESGKTYSPLVNVDINYQLQFEKFLVDEKSDNESESDSEDNKEDEQNDENEVDTENIEAQDENSIIENILPANEQPSTSSQEFTLKSEELEVVESCYHKELKDLLYLNRSKNFMLMQLYKKVKDSLKDCKSEMHSLTSVVIPKQTEKQSMAITNLAAPYFKTKKEMFSCDPNPDTIDRRNKGILSIYSIYSVPKWSKEECENLIIAVKLNYNHNKQKKILRDISTEKFRIQKDQSDEVKEKSLAKIAILESELKRLEKVTGLEIPQIESDEFLDWEHISMEYMKEKHNGSECRSFWHLYLHPGINKGNWTKQENEKIKQLAEKFNQQNWELIAEELGTERSGFSVCIHYFSALYEAYSRQRFTKEEDALLLRSIEKMRIGSFIPWAAVEANFENRSKQQLIHRYRYYLSAADADRSAFTDAEDVLLLILVRRYGPSFSLFTPHFRNRSYVKIKHRYNKHLRNVRSDRAAFTLDDDRQIVDFFDGRHVDRTMTIQRLAEELNRDRMQLRQRYKTLKFFLDKNEGKELADAPRRLTGTSGGFKQLEFLKYVADQYAHAPDVPTIEEIERDIGTSKKKKGGRKRKFDDSCSVDNLLVNYFSHAYSLKRKPIELNAKKMQETSDHMFDILKQWKCHLNVPENLKRSTHQLDVVDQEILAALREKFVGNVADISAPVDDLIPPNINTMVGLRALLLKNKLHRKTKNNESMLTLIDDIPLIRNKFDKNSAKEIAETMKNLSPEKRNRVEDECCIFLERFVSLFLWPAVFSLESPSETLLESEMCVPKKKTENSEEKSCASHDRKTKWKKDELNVEIRPKKAKLSIKAKTRSIETGKLEEIGVKRSLRLQNLREKREKEEKCDVSTGNKKGIVEDDDIVEKRENQKGNLPEAPLNLRRVDKEEVERMMKNSKKPVKMYMIQKVKMQDGTIKTVTKLIENDKLPGNLKKNDTPSVQKTKPLIKVKNISKLIENKSATTTTSNCEISVKKENVISEYGDNIDILDIVSLANSVKKENSVEEIPEEDNKDFGIVLKNNIKQYSARLSRKLVGSSNKTNAYNISRSMMEKEKEDVDKLNDFLNNCHSSSNNEPIDLTEEEVTTRQDVRMLNELINSENEII